ncbi:Putative DNA-binding protein [Alloactinosynnema sp. L-07]|uniref:helix-turn-helix domain-containing protein n=1 Tax=Alloactinosynnema sp. L-07 TaxID=1653480 RepID=UPI00065F0A8C|nr:helix-turn-helix transcriptional regulator [Alloactinosynnema sp. L-07]CRK59218.1 Putative DNA-binding protein [Alloactinosynnema sp. L-07]
MNESGLPRALQSGSPALFRRMINLSLKRWRDEAGLKQAESATRIGRSIAHISNIENDRLPPASDLELLLDLYGKGDRIPFMRELLAAARNANRWWASLSGNVPKWFDLFLGLEFGATELASFDCRTVPGMLQTPAYAHAVISGNPNLSEAEVAQLVEVRVGRQQILDRDNEPARLVAVVDESVLYRKRGDGHVMIEQMKHLIEASRRPQIELLVLPFDAAPNPAQDGGSFYLLDFPTETDDPGLVYVELVTGGEYVEDARDIEQYRHALDTLRDLAADQKSSRAIIQRALKEVKL